MQSALTVGAVPFQLTDSNQKKELQVKWPDSSCYASLCEPEYNYDENSDFADRSWAKKRKKKALAIKKFQRGECGKVVSGIPLTKDLSLQH